MLTEAPPAEEFQPATTAELQRFVTANAVQARRPLCPVGGRTSFRRGGPTSSGTIVNFADLCQVRDYPARDMTITVDAGMRFSTLANVLAAERQQLPIDVPRSDRATVGGIVAGNASGPRRFGYGTLRDYVIGIEAIDGQGRLFHSGGRVVKNVAGYDLCKLLIGSRGTLAFITQVTFKLRPLTPAEGLLWAAFDTLSEIENVLDRLVVSDARPTALDVLMPAAARQIRTEMQAPVHEDGAVLCVTVDGSEDVVAGQLETLRRELSPFSPAGLELLDSAGTVAVRNAICEFGEPSDEPAAFRASLRPSRTIELLEKCREHGLTAVAHAGNGIVVGHVSDEITNHEQAAAALNMVANEVGADRGAFEVTDCLPEWAEQMKLPLPGKSATARLPQVKQAFDPYGILRTDPSLV